MNRSLLVSAIAMTLNAFGAVESHAARMQDTGKFQERGPRFFLTEGVTVVRVDAGQLSVLTHRVSLVLNDVTLEEALTQIAARAGLRLFYTKGLLPSAKRVSLDARELTVAAALTDVLLDTKLDVLFSTTGQAALVKRADVQPPLFVGSIDGRVTDKETGAPLVGAGVTVVGTTLGNNTDEDGRYRITGVPVGQPR